MASLRPKFAADRIGPVAHDVPVPFSVRESTNEVVPPSVTFAPAATVITGVGTVRSSQRSNPGRKRFRFRGADATFLVNRWSRREASVATLSDMAGVR